MISEEKTFWLVVKCVFQFLLITSKEGLFWTGFGFSSDSKHCKNSRQFGIFWIFIFIHIAHWTVTLQQPMQKTTPTRISLESSFGGQCTLLDLRMNEACLSHRRFSMASFESHFSSSSKLSLLFTCEILLVAGRVYIPNTSSRLELEESLHKVYGTV